MLQAQQREVICIAWEGSIIHGNRFWYCGRLACWFSVGIYPLISCAIADAIWPLSACFGVVLHSRWIFLLIDGLIRFTNCINLFSQGLAHAAGPLVVGSCFFANFGFCFSKCLAVCWLADFWMLVFKPLFKQLWIPNGMQLFLVSRSVRWQA